MRVCSDHFFSGLFLFTFFFVEKNVVMLSKCHTMDQKILTSILYFYLVEEIINNVTVEKYLKNVRTNKNAQELEIYNYNF